MISQSRVILPVKTRRRAMRGAIARPVWGSSRSWPMLSRVGLWCPPRGAIRKAIALQGFGSHLCREPCIDGHHITAAADARGVKEVFMQVICELDRTVFHRATDGHVVGHR